jgi:naked cuticle
VTAGASSHYHRRHRHREKNHDLAMQQVAAWIERQNVWHVLDEGERVIVQKHQHHHIHEHHHHHHYHHYYEA